MMKQAGRLVPQPSMVWRWVAGCAAWWMAVMAVALLAPAMGIGVEVPGPGAITRAMLSPLVVGAAAVTAVLWVIGLVVGGSVALALALLSSRRRGGWLALPGLGLEWLALLPAWLLPWWLARDSLESRRPLPALWQSWGIPEESMAGVTFDFTPWLVAGLVALVVAGVTLGRMRHALLRARRRLAESPPLAARGLSPAALEYRHRLGGAAPALVHAMRDALPWSLLMLLTAGVLLRGPGLAFWLSGWGESGAVADGGVPAAAVAGWLWLGWLWCGFTGVGAWAERVAGGVPMVVASLQRVHGTLLGLETGRWGWPAWGLPLLAVPVAVAWLSARVGTVPWTVPAAAGSTAVLLWAVSIYMVSGRPGPTGLWLAYLARGGGHWPWWVAALMGTWGLGMAWWHGLLLALAGSLLEGTSRARQLASFWVRAGAVSEACEAIGLRARDFRRRHLLPALGLAMMPWMLARVALLLMGAVVLQASQWLPAALAGEPGAPAFPFGWEQLAMWAWPLATVALSFRVSCRLWERARWRLASRRRPVP